MKLKDLFVLDAKMERRKLKLKKEIHELQKNLEEQRKLQMILKHALEKPLMYRHYLSTSVPHKVKLLLSEIASVEGEILCLEEKISKLGSHLHHEKNQNEELMSHKQYQRKNHHGSNSCLLETRSEPGNLKESPFHTERISPWRPCSGKVRCKFIRSLSLRDEDESSRCRKENGSENRIQNPNHLSEELIKCLIGIFLALNRAPQHTSSEPSLALHKLALSCMRSRSFISKTSFYSKASISLSEDTRRRLDPFGIVATHDSLVVDIGAYKNYIQFDSKSLDFSRMPRFISYLDKLRVLINKLCIVDLRFLTHKQKLAFWINVHNVCIMNAFLQYGLPSMPEKLLFLMNKASLNVDGIALTVLIIQNFILRQPSEFDNEGYRMDEKEVLLSHVYGLVYPEPNVIFALCHGTRSSPAVGEFFLTIDKKVRVYTAENVMSELEMAKAEYLQASIAVTPKKRILLPKLLLWYMPNFADGLNSLLEWIYSQLPRSAPYRNSIMECLKEDDRKRKIQKMVDVQPYDPEFRYILAL